MVIGMATKKVTVTLCEETLRSFRDQGLFASALARPKNLLAYADAEPDLAELAAAYAFGLARNHPYLDGNKYPEIM